MKPTLYQESVDPYFQPPAPPFWSDEKWVQLMSTLRVVAGCALMGFVCWLRPDVIDWLLVGAAFFLFLLAVV